MLNVCCRGKGKVDGVQTDDEEIRSDLETFQPPPTDTRATISPEEVTSIPALPRGVCTGTLIPSSDSCLYCLIRQKQCPCQCQCSST